MIRILSLAYRKKRAAHIVPVAKGGVDDITNGICLCTNHELAFDKGLIKIRPDGKIEVKSSELKEIYDKILFPKDKQNYKSIKFNFLTHNKKCSVYTIHV